MSDLTNIDFTVQRDFQSDESAQERLERTIEIAEARNRFKQKWTNLKNTATIDKETS